MEFKRFTLNESNIYNQKDVIFDNNIELPQSTACDLLNELYDENQQLKDRIRKLEIENEAQSDAIDGLQETLTHLDLEDME